MHPRDALERLALSQMLLVHGRVAWLSNCYRPKQTPRHLGLSARVSNDLGQLYPSDAAIREQREPENSSTTVSIGQANVAGQQVVQNLMKEERRGKKMTNKLGLCERPVQRPPPLPANEGRIALLRIAIRRNQPWTRSMGPKTDDGKARVRTNALVTVYDQPPLLRCERS